MNHQPCWFSSHIHWMYPLLSLPCSSALHFYAVLTNIIINYLHNSNQPIHYTLPTSTVRSIKPRTMSTVFTTVSPILREGSNTECVFSGGKRGWKEEISWSKLNNHQLFHQTPSWLGEDKMYIEMHVYSYVHPYFTEAVNFWQCQMLRLTLFYDRLKIKKMQCMKSESVSHSVVSNSFRPSRL